jgi:hypothetical protein
MTVAANGVAEQRQVPASGATDLKDSASHF